MENQIDIVEEKKQEKLFASMVGAIVFAIVAVLLIFTAQKDGVNDKENLIKAFNSNEQIVCSSKIVSLSNGFKFDEKRENYITNGVDIFLISKCTLK